MRKIVLYPWKENNNRVLGNLINQAISDETQEESDIELMVLIDESMEKEVVYKDTLPFGTQVQINIIPITGKNPTEKIQFLSEWLKEVVRKEDQLYLNMGNGHLHHMLAHTCIQTYHNQLSLLSEQGNPIEYFKEAPLEEKMSDMQFYHHVHEFLLSGNYQSAKKIINSRYKNPDIDKLLDFGQGLFLLELENKAHKNTNMFSLLIDVLTKIDKDDEEIAYVRRMEKLKSSSQIEFIFFIYNYANFLYKSDELIDFVVLYYRLVEESLLYGLGWDYVEQSSGAIQFVYNSDRRYNLNFPSWNLNRYFHHYFKALKQEMRNIEKRYTQVKIHRNKCVGLEKLNDKERYFADLFLKYYDKELNEFLDLRHEGVSGHGFADFTKEKFIDVCGGVPPLEKINPILEEMGLLPEHSLFESIQKAVLGLLKEEMEEAEVVS